ncbi:hypothetical protein ACOMHN_065826 [Nucella lapillus]
MLAFVVAFCACVTLASACSCPMMYGLKRFCQYDLIVRGTTLAEYEEKEGPQGPFSQYASNSYFVYSIIVTQAIKVPESMKGSKMISIRSPSQFSMCGTRLALDVDGVYFGVLNDKGQAQTGTCSPNAPWALMSEEDRAVVTDRIVPYCASHNGSLPIIGPPSIPLPPSMTPPPGYKP